MQYDDLLEQKVGYGWGQIKIFLIIGFIWMTDAGELLLIGFLNPVLQIQWKITQNQQSLLASSIFIAQCIGILFTLYTSDKYGRILQLQISSIGIFITGFLSTFSQNIYQLIGIRFLLGICLGIPGPIISVFLSEISDPQNRGKKFVLTNIYFIIGQLVVVLMAYYTLDSFNSEKWRWLLMQTSFIGLFAVITVFLWGYESPRYLMIKGKMKESIEILSCIALDNGKQGFSQEDIGSQNIDNLHQWANEQNKKTSQYSSNIKSLFQNGRANITIKLGLIWFSQAFVYFGLLFQLPTIMKKMNQNDTNNTLDMNQIYENMALQAFAEVPSTIIAYLLIDSQITGRKWSLFISFIIQSFFSILIYLMQNKGFIFWVMIIKCATNLSFLISNQYTAEMYTTLQRGTGSSFGHFVCRFGGIIMPWIIVIMFIFGTFGPFIAFAGITIISAIANYFMPTDTAGVRLDEIQYEQINNQNDNNYNNNKNE